jgi:ligand-binding sensor domain-containing protein/signal transduction histidine kinase
MLTVFRHVDTRIPEHASDKSYVLSRMRWPVKSASKFCYSNYCGIFKLTNRPLFIFLLLLSPFVWSAPYYTAVERFSVYDGMPEATIFSMASDSHGFLWLGNSSGLVRYDGHSFELYSIAINSPIPLNVADAGNIYIDSKDRIWIGSWGQGVAVYHNDLSFIAHYRNNTTAPSSLGSDTIQVFFEDSDGDIWIGTNGGGLALFENATGTFTNFLNDPLDKTSIAHNRIWSISQTVDGIVWIGTNNGLSRLDKGSNGVFANYQQLPTVNNDLASISFVRTLLALEGGHLWIGTNDSLGKLDIGSGIYYPIEIPDPEFKGALNKIVADHNDGLLIGTSQGLYRFDLQQAQFTPLKNDSSHGLFVNNDIRDMLTDTSGGLWIGTRFSGLIKIDLAPTIFKTYTQATAVDGSVDTGPIFAVHVASTGEVWLGTIRGLMYYSEKTDLITQISTETQNFNALAEDDKGTLWIGGYKGLYGLNLQTRVLLNRNDLMPFKSTVSINALLVSDDGSLWVGTSHDGLIKIDQGTSERFVHQKNRQSSLSSNSINRILQDRQGRIWLATNGGALNRFDPTHRSFKRYPYLEQDTTSIGGLVVNTLYQASDDVIWVGMQRSLDKLNPASNTFSHLGLTNGLANSNVKGIIEDNDGRLWLSTGKGISKFDTNEATFTNFTDKKGVKGNVFLASAADISRTGTIYFGGNKGLTKIKPAKLIINDRKPVAVVTKTWIDQQRVKKAVFANNAAFAITHDTKSIRFEYTLLDFKNPSQNQYKYRLHGFESQWHDGNQSRQANYTNLRPGQYSFQLKGRNDSGQWSNTNAVDIVVTPAWWTLWWVISLFIGTVLNLIYLLHRFRLMTLAKRNTWLQAEVALKTEDLLATQQQLIESEKHSALSGLVAGVAHEINTPVGIGVTAVTTLQELTTSLLQGYKNKTLKQRDFVEKLTRIEQSTKLIFSNLNRAAELINSFKKVAVDQMSEEQRTFDFSRYLHEVVLSLQPKLQKKQVMIYINCPENITVNSFPGAIAQILSNLLLNAYYHAFDERQDKRVDIKVKLHDELIYLDVSDNGNGISKEQQSKIFDPFYTTKRNRGGSGLGLHIIKNVVDKVLRGSINCESKPGEGSCFHMVFQATPDRD